jgi:filamentous hemagglutinin
MNKQFYRTKFNAKLGTYVAVSELAKSHQGDTSPRVKSTIDPQNQGGGLEHITDTTNTGQRTLRQLVLALSSLMVITPIYANVTVNKNAAAAHQATVLKAGNAANVWITAPSASGVSRNSYTQFDVNQNGVILNNSRGAATSQITKTSIAANPNLAKGAATTIVNEVVSSNPSLLQGNLEVLGSRANVVIANPTGITVNGGGFINANQVTLSTGALSYNSDGSIKQHTVKQGAITINPDVNKRGLGGNANNPIALELLGRSIAINAPVNADTITAVTGANTIAADTTEITTTTGSGTKPTVAIDVAQLGGLYANSIYLYANEAGVGVNNAGVIQAQNNVVLTSKGKIEHQGTISSTSKTQGLVSISTTGTGVAGDINSSGSINSYGILSIDAGNDINVKAKDITLNYGGATSSPLMLNANGSLNLAASTKVSNLGNLGDLYIDAKNITLGSGSELRSNRGSAMIQANNSLVSNKGGFVAAKDLSLFGNTNLKLTDTRLHASTGDINLQSSLKDSITNTINVQGGTVYALKGLNVFSDQDITLNNINFLKKTNSTLAQINSLNVYAGNNLSFTTANQVFPYTAGKIQLGAGNVLTVQGMGTRSTLKGGGGLSLSGKSVTTKNIQLAGSGAQDLDIISNGGNILLDQGTNLWANTGNINVNAVNGSITANSLQATTLGKTSLVASKNVILAANKVETAVTGTDAKNVKYTPSKITAEKGIYVASIDNGYLRLNTISLDAKNGDIQLDAKKGSISLLRSDEVTQQKNADGSFSPKKTYLWSELNGKNILINSGTNNSLLWGNLTSTGNIQVQAKGTQYLYGLNLKSGANTTLHSDGRQTLHSIMGQSTGHTALSTDDRLYLNSSIVTADGTTSWASGGTVKLQTDGVLSLVSGAGQYLQNTDLKGGAILIESGAGLDVNKNVKVTAVGSSLLNNDKGLKNLNGDLSIQTHNDLTIDPKLLTLNAAGDYDLTSKNSDLTLLGYGGTNGNGSEQVVKLNSVNGGINLAGQKIELQGSQLNAAKDISIVSTSGDLIVDGVRNTFVNAKKVENYTEISNIQKKVLTELELLKSQQFLNDYSNMVKLYEDWIKGNYDVKIYTQYDQAYKDFINTYPVKPNPKLLIFGLTTPLFHNILYEAKPSTRFAASYVFFPKYDQEYLNTLQADVKFFENNLNGYGHQGAILTSDTGNINLASKQGLSVSGAKIDAQKGSVLIEASGTLANEEHQIQGEFKSNIQNSVKQGAVKGSIIIDATQDSYEVGKETDSNYNWRSPVNATTISGDKGVKIKAAGKRATDNLILQGVGITSTNGNVDIEAYKNIIFDVAVENSYDKSKKTETKRKWYGKKKTTTTIKTAERVGGVSVDIDAKNINIISEEQKKADDKDTGPHRTSIDMYSSQLTANGGKVTISAGGDINLLTADNISKDTLDISKSSSWIGIKLNKSKYTSTRNIKSELPAVLEASYIGAQADGSIVLKGTEFNYLEGAEIKAGEKISLLGASELVEATKSKKSNSVVWQSMQDQGSITETAQLPSFNGPVAPKFEAKGGLTVQVPVVSGKNNDVTAEIIKLSKQPGNEYLKSLIARKDVNWEAVKLAQENWDYKSQGLTGAGAAIIVLIVTVLTSGAGTAAATSVTSATGVASLGVGAQAAVTTLASQATVSLINNGGDISKTLKDLGSKDSVRNLATSVVTAGLLSQVGASLNLKPDSAYFPDRLMNNFTNTVGSTLVQTAINGGNLQDNLEKALLAGLSSSLQGELASQIGTTFGQLEPGTLEYVLHKIAHAAAGCATAAAADSSCGAGAIGAGVGEIVAALMIPEGKTALDLTEAERKSITDTSKIVAGTVSAFAGYDVITAANKAEIAVENNTLKPLSTAGKAVWKTAKAIKAELDAGKKLTANDIPGLLKDVVKGEIQNGGDSIKTILDPSATAAEKSLAILDLVIGVNLKAGKNVDVLKVDQKVIKKNVSREIEIPKVNNFEQARNVALKETNLNGSNSIPVICRLPCSAGNGMVVGRKSQDGKLIWRLDYDPIKGPHINIEDYRLGKGDKAIKKYVQFDGNEETFKLYLKQLNN